jgi:ABC-type transporter Mla MlaB component
MLRITVHDKPRALTFQLEGSLAGAWVRVLEECWQGARARRRRPDLRVDLTGVTFIDAAGRACLAAMHQHGAEFVAADCLTKAVVAEITQEPHPDRVCSSGTGESRPQRNGGATWPPTR